MELPTHDKRWSYKHKDGRIVHDRCKHCGKPPTPEGHDACLKTLPGVMHACCGHGVEEGMVRFWRGMVLRGKWDHISVPWNALEPRNDIRRETLKDPKTPAQIAAALLEWYGNGQKGLETFCKQCNPEAAVAATHWFEKGKARFLGFIEAINNLEESNNG